MSDEMDMLREIEAHEGWLRQAMPAESPPSLAELKLNVRVAAQEAWLARTVPDQTAAPNLDAVKRAVRTELALAAARQERHGRHRWAAWVGGCSAVAAILALVVLLRQNGPGEPTPTPAGFATAAIEDWSAALNDTVLVSQTQESEWAELETEIVALEETLAEGTSSTWSETEYDDLGDDLDALLEEISQDS